MTSQRMIRALALTSLLAACSGGYSTPDPQVGEPKEQSVSSESKRTPEPVSESSGEGPKKGTPDEAKRQPTEASGSCDDRSCVSTDDCCKGYQCGFDPERSKVQRYCLSQ